MIFGRSIGERTMPAAAAAALLVSGGAAGADLFKPSLAADARIAQAGQAYERYEEAHGRIARVNGIAMHYLEWGEPDPVPLIWAHGFSSTAYEFVEVGPGLAEAGLHVIAVTYRGHGRTGLPAAPFSLADIADDLAALMDLKGLSCSVVGGLSLGGAVATTFYENYPDRVAGLVLEDGGSYPMQEVVEALFAADPEGRSDPPAAHRATYGTRVGAVRAIAAPYAPFLGGVLEDIWAMAFHSFVRPGARGGFVFHADQAAMLGSGRAAVDPALSHELPLLARSWRRVNPEITYRNAEIPILVIDPTGDDTAFSLSPYNARLKSVNPEHVTVLAYEHTLHAAHLQRPDRLVRDVAALARQVRNCPVGGK